MYKKVLIMGMTLLSSLNFCFGANIQCWEEYRIPWNGQTSNFSASDSKLYNTLKDKATVIFVGVTSYKQVGGSGDSQVYTAIPTTYIVSGIYQSDYIALKFCAVFNDSGSSSTSTNSTAAVNYIIKAK